MKIKKVAQTPGVLATVSTSKIDSDKDTYSCNYLNDNAVVVSPTEPSDGKVWLQKGKNLWGGIKRDIVFNGLTTNIKDDKFTMTGTAEWTAWCFESKGRPFINLKAGTYTFSIRNFTGSFNKAISLNITHSGGTIVDVAVNSTSIKDYYKEFTLTQDTPLYLDFYINSNGINFNNVSFNIQVEKGTKPSTYESYIPKKIHTKTDSGYEEFYNEESNDIGWSTLEVPSDVSGSSGQTLKIRKKNGIVNIVGNVKIAGSSWNKKIIELPLEFKPAQEINFVCRGLDSEGDAHIITISDAGRIGYLAGVNKSTSGQTLTVALFATYIQD